MVKDAKEKNPKTSLNQNSIEILGRVSSILSPILKLPVYEINNASNQSHH